jgi:hydroxymethylbilane synthase
MSPQAAADAEVDAPPVRSEPALRLGTRGSPLALAQTRLVAARLGHATGRTCEIVVIATQGDRLAEAPVADAGGKRVFVKELEDALLGGEVDLAVHSSKDLSATLPDGLVIGGALPREDPRDAIVLPRGRAAAGSVADLAATLGPEPRIGTSSARRVAQLAPRWADARFLPVRGNLGTRLGKVDRGDYDALVLAAAGLCRLHQAGRISCLLPIDVCLPAPGQGIIAVEIRRGDDRVRAAVSRIDDRRASASLEAERAVVVGLEGGCHMPIGAYADVDGDTIVVRGIVLSPDGARVARADDRGPVADARGVGARVADRLLALGAAAILADARARHGWSDPA